MRTFMSENGTEYTRTEVVKSQPVIDAYVRLMGHGMYPTPYIITEPFN